MERVMARVSAVLLALAGIAALGGATTVESGADTEQTLWAALAADPTSQTGTNHNESLLAG